jgi:hypothetical protein
MICDRSHSGHDAAGVARQTGRGTQGTRIGRRARMNKESYGARAGRGERECTTKWARSRWILFPITNYIRGWISSKVYFLSTKFLFSGKLGKQSLKVLCSNNFFFWHHKSFCIGRQRSEVKFMIDHDWITQEIQPRKKKSRYTGRTSLYLYRSLGCQEGSRLVG